MTAKNNNLGGDVPSLASLDEATTRASFTQQAGRPEGINRPEQQRQQETRQDDITLPSEYSFGTLATSNVAADESVHALVDGINSHLKLLARGQANSPYMKEASVSFLQHQNGVSLYKLTWNKLAFGIIYLDRPAQSSPVDLRSSTSLITTHENKITERIAATEDKSMVYVSTIILTPRSVANIDALITRTLAVMNSNMIAMNPSNRVSARALIKHLNGVVGATSGRFSTCSSILSSEARPDGLGHIPGISVSLEYIGDNGVSTEVLAVAVKPTFHGMHRGDGQLVLAPIMVVTDLLRSTVLPSPELHAMSIDAVHRELAMTNNWVIAFTQRGPQQMLFEIANCEYEKELMNVEDLRAVIPSMFPPAIIAVDEIIGYPQIAGLDGLVPAGDGTACYMAKVACRFYGYDFTDYAAFATNVDSSFRISASSTLMGVGIDSDLYIDSRQYGLIEMLQLSSNQAALARDIVSSICTTEAEAMYRYGQLTRIVPRLPDVPQFLVKRHLLSEAFVNRLAEVSDTCFKWHRSNDIGTARGFFCRAVQPQDNYGNATGLAGGTRYDRFTI